MPLSRTASAKCSAYYTDTAIQYNVSPSIVKKHLRMSKCSLSKQKLRNSCIPPSIRVITSEVSACDDTDIASNNAGTTNILFIIKT